jgi:hypothetical protein
MVRANILVKRLHSRRDDIYSKYRIPNVGAGERTCASRISDQDKEVSVAVRRMER